MADYNDDFVFAGSAGDNFNCNNAGGWDTTNFDIAIGSGNGVDDGDCLELNCNSGTAGYFATYHDVSNTYRFKITEKALVFWFSYIKGKGANYLTTTADAFVVRLFFDGTTKYADYRLTANGDTDLRFGWQSFLISGKNMNGGSVGGGHNDGTDWDTDIHRIELRFNFANPNDGNDAPVKIDNFFVGTKVTLQSGSATDQRSWTDLESYVELGTTRTDGPLGVIDVEDVFVNIKCSIEIGNGSGGWGNEGYLSDDSKFLLFNQWSEEVKCHLTVEDHSTLILGTRESGTDAVYAVGGCQLVLPANRYSDFDIKDGGTVELFDTKIYRWRNVYFGASSDNSATVELNQIDIDSCETVYFRSTNLEMKNVEIHDNAQQVRDHCGEMLVSPDSNENLLVHDCKEGIHFKETLSIEEYYAQDNSSDLAVLEGKTLTLINSIFDKAKLKRITS